MSFDASRLQPMTVADVDTLLAIEARAYSHPWTRGNFVDSLAAGHLAQVLRDRAGDCIGYVVAMHGVDEVHVLNLTIAPAWQRRGHGLALLHWLCEQVRHSGAHGLWLEVRHGNLAARRLYSRAGFAEVALRRNYYPAGTSQREDAVVMRRGLAGATDALV